MGGGSKRGGGGGRAGRAAVGQAVLGKRGGVGWGEGGIQAGGRGWARRTAVEQAVLGRRRAGASLQEALWERQCGSYPAPALGASATDGLHSPRVKCALPAHMLDFWANWAYNGSRF